jgi:ORF6N domain-containing protein
MSPTRATDTLALQNIAPLIHEIRSERVILDADLARIYGVTVKALNQAVKRNADRFPEDFAFRLTRAEYDSLRSQIVTLKRGQHRKYAPHAFTEHGAIMAANVLNSKQAVEMSVFVVRAFVRLRDMLATHKDLAAKIDELDRRVGSHDKAIGSIIAAIRQLTAPAARKSGAIGFRAKRDVADARPKQHVRATRKK